MKTQPENNGENQEPGPARSSEQGTGQDPTNPGNARTAKRTKTAPHLVDRVTALRGQGIARSPEPKSIVRRQTQADIYSRDAEIPYVKFEAAARNLVCSLMERQDRMNEEIFSKMNDLGYRVEDLEEDRPAAGGPP